MNIKDVFQKLKTEQANVGFSKLKDYFKPLDWLFKANRQQKMSSPDKWLFYVDSSATGQICFKLAMYPEKRQNCGLSNLGPTLRYFVTGYPVDRSWMAKNPQFAAQEDAVFKTLESSGYRQVWPIHGGLISGGTVDSVKHTVGRKRRRQPTIDQEEVEEEEDDDRDAREGQSTTGQGIQSQPQHYKRGLLIGLPHEQVVEYRIEIGQILKQHGFRTGIEFHKVADEQWQCDYMGQSFQLVKGISADGDVPLHPAFRDTDSNLLFHSLDQVLEVLKQCPDNSHTKELKRLMPSLEAESETDRTLHHPFVVIEGLDASGKTTLVNKLSERLGAVQLKSPPECLASLRRQYDHQPALIRRVYYTFGNYITGKEIVQQCARGPVIIDRFWYSSAAYAIAAQCCGDINSLLPHDSYVYQWPSDLPRPSLVLLLTLSEEERERRMTERIETTGEQLTKEEGTLKRDRRVRERILEAYRRMRDPEVVEINADGTREEVFESVLLQLRAHRIIT